MSKNDSQIIEIIARQAKIEPTDLTRDTTLADLGLESLDIVEIVFAIEERFDIEIPFNANASEMTGMHTVGDVVKSTEALIRGA